MNAGFMPHRTALVVLLSMLCSSSVAQQRVVIADRDTHEPVAQASLYTKEGGRFCSSVTNNMGVALVRFDFQRLTVSHLNYERRQVRRLTDTIFLVPRHRQTREVVVRNVEPSWIRPFLKRFARTKDYRYFVRPTVLDYDYQTQSISANSLYRFHSQGLLRQKDKTHGQHAICQQDGLITAADSTRLTDVANLRRMLYEDFVQELDADFIGEHVFRENSAYKGQSKNEVELVFWAAHRKDDRGRFVVDTARCVVLSAWRQCGTKSNMHLRMPRFLYLMAQTMSGYRIDQWNTYYDVSYDMLPDGQLFPGTVRYKFYLAGYDHSDDKDEWEYRQQTGGGFPNMEATLRLRPCKQVPDTVGWKPLPGSWYIRLSSEEERQQEIDLSHMPARFELFDEE